MKKYRMILIVLGTALILSSCQKDISTDEDNSMVVPVEISKHITKNLDKNLKIDADIIVPEKIQSEVEILEIEPENLDAKAIINKLYPNAVALYKDRDIYEDGGVTINISNGNYHYDNKNKRIYSRFFVKQEELRYPVAENLVKLDVNESLEEAKNYLAEIGYENIKLNGYYVLSKEFLEEEYYENKKEESWQEDVDAGREIVKEDWQDEKGAYIFNFDVIEHDLPISQDMYVTKDNEYIRGSSITICCSEDGVAFVEAVKNYSVKASNGSKKIVGTDIIIKGIEQKFSNLIIEEPIIINEMRLVYQAQKIKEKLYFIPIWEVQYLQQCEGINEKGTIYFDVETGKEIVVY
ncbi:hypothetical protein DSECCO2_272060 [anaerobic digester metagenome]